MKNMSLEKIAQACGGVLVLPGSETLGLPKVQSEEQSKTQMTAQLEISGAVLDSRQVAQGDLFVATVGERVDGHKFIGSVFAKGALCVLTQKTPAAVEAEHQVPAQDWGAYILVEDTLQALKEIAEYYRSTLQIPIVGITGSVGKTSTKEYIAGVLAQKYHVLKTEGNFNNEIGVPLTLLRIREEHQVAVVEMGISDFGEMHRLSKMVRPNVCVITNIGQCHLENLGTRDGILKAKSEIFDFMAQDGKVCFNGEDDKLAEVLTVKGNPVYFFGLGENTREEVYVSDVVSKGLFGSTAMMHVGEDVFPVMVTQPGIHMVTNAAAAACVGNLLGVSKEEIAEGIKNVQPVSGRSNLMALSHYTVIDDCYNANPVSMRAAIDLLMMANTEKVAILGDMFELGEDSDRMHREVGRYAVEAGVDTLICIGENAEHMLQGAQSARAEKYGCTDAKNTVKPGRSFHFKTRDEFLQTCENEVARTALLGTDSTILIKASHGMAFPPIIAFLQRIDQ